jgi:hypothetical protein
MMVTNSDIAKAKGWRPITYQGMGKGNGLWTKWVTPEHDTEITLPDWTGNIADAWTLVEETQKEHPGWRFCLLGGDVEMGYKKRKSGDNIEVDENSRYPFGWKAEFFGELDPRKDYGQRHAEAYAPTAPQAICEAYMKWKGA